MFILFKERNVSLVKNTPLQQKPLPRSVFGITYLAGFRTIGIKLNLFYSQFSSSISIVTQIYSAKCTLTQQFTKSPVSWSSWC